MVEDLPGASSKGSAGGPAAPAPPTVEILEGDVLYREWVPGPAGRGWWLGIAIPLVFGAGTAYAALHGGVFARAVAVVVCALCAVTAATAFNFRGLALVVDRGGLAWRFGIISRRYPLDEISMFRERNFHFPQAGAFGGWGIGRARDGVDTYEVWGANGTALDLVVRRGEVTKHYLVSTVAPDRLVVQLVRAMERREPNSGSDTLG